MFQSLVLFIMVYINTAREWMSADIALGLAQRVFP
jgi:hypothetical protein